MDELEEKRSGVDLIKMHYIYEIHKNKKLN